MFLPSFIPISQVPLYKSKQTGIPRKVGIIAPHSSEFETALPVQKSLAAFFRKHRVDTEEQKIDGKQDVSSRCLEFRKASQGLSLKYRFAEAFLQAEDLILRAKRIENMIGKESDVFVFEMHTLPESNQEVSECNGWSRIKHTEILTAGFVGSLVNGASLLSRFRDFNSDAEKVAKTRWHGSIETMIDQLKAFIVKFENLPVRALEIPAPLTQNIGFGTANNEFETMYCVDHYQRVNLSEKTISRIGTELFPALTVKIRS